jgi:gluconolactonase
MKKQAAILVLILLGLGAFAQPANLIADGAKLEKACTGYGFTEGPAVDKDGKIYFTDQNFDRIYVWDEVKGCELWLEGTNRANGMIFDKKGRLIACTELKNELGWFDKDKKFNLIASGYNGKLLNAPNDVWVTKKGEYYFTDPYWQRSFWPKDRKEQQDVKAVYFVNKKGEIKRVVNDFKVPNGIIGTPDGKTLYIADMGDRKTWKYKMLPNGDLTDKTFFAPAGSDGMVLDNQGNVYLTGRKVQVYSPAGELIHEIEVPETPSNVAFGGKNRDILFITARTSVYTLKMKVKGIE